MTTQSSHPVPQFTIEDLQTKLQGRDPFESMEGLLPALEQAVAGIPESKQRAPEAPGKWSVLDVVQHLADTEMVYGVRLRMILSEENPPLQAFQQNMWQQNLGYGNTQLQDAMDQLRAIRKANLRLARRYEDRLDRQGIHSEMGPMNARLLVYMLANHDLTHLRQIERIKEHVGA